MMSSSLPHAHVGCYVLDRLIHTSEKHEKKKKKKKNKQKKKKKRQKKKTHMYSGGYDVNGTIAEKEGTF